MKAKKILAGACASLMLTSMAASAVSAAEAVKVTVGNDTAEAGAKFSVNIDLADLPSTGINGIDFAVKYDSTALKIDSVKPGELAVEDTSISDVDTIVVGNDEAGITNIIYANITTPITKSGTFVTVEGTVNENAKAGKYDLSIVAIGRDNNDEVVFGYHTGAADDAGVYYTPTITNGYVEVTSEDTSEATEATEATEDTKPSETEPTEDIGEPTLLGDVDCGGKVAVADLTLLSKHILNKSLFTLTEQGKANADMNADKKIDSNDSGALAELLVG